MKEYIDLLDSDGNCIGIIDRKKAHESGAWHKTIHAWVINAKGDVLLAKRGKRKNFYPSCWDCSFAGHVGIDEGAVDCAIREAHEEIGVHLFPQDLIHVCTYKDVLAYGSQTCNQIAEVYVVEKELKISSLKVAKDEVDDLKWVPAQTFLKEILSQKGNYLFHGEEEYKALQKFLKDKYKVV